MCDCWNGNCMIADSMHLDLAQLDAIEIDTVKLTAKIGPGADFDRMYAAVDKVGLAVVGGMCGTVAPVGTVRRTEALDPHECCPGAPLTTTGLAHTRSSRVGTEVSRQPWA